MSRPLTAIEAAADRGVRIATAVVLFYLVAPVFAVIPLSFTAGTLLVYPLPGLSLQWYEDFFTSPLWTRALWNSLLFAVTTTALATTLGTLAAVGLTMSRWKFARILAGLLIAPLVVPIVIVAVALFYYLARINLIGTYPAIIIAHTVLAIPFVLITVSATLKGFDFTLMRAAQSLGASPWLAFRRVMLPLISPGLIAGALFAFVTSFDEIVIVLFIASPEQRTLPRQIFSGVSESISPTIAVAAVVLVLVSIALMSVVECMRRRSARLAALSPVR